MTGGGARRDDLIAQVADYILAEGLAAATLRPLARALGTSDRMLLYYFQDKDDLLRSAARHLAARLTALLADLPANPMPSEPLLAGLLTRIGDPAIRPYLALWLDMATRAMRGDSLWQEVGAEVGAGFLDFIASRLDLPDPGQRTAVARDILARIEGEVVLRAVGLR